MFVWVLCGECNVVSWSCVITVSISPKWALKLGRHQSLKTKFCDVTWFQEADGFTLKVVIHEWEH